MPWLFPWFILGSNYDNWALYACAVRDQHILPQGKTITKGDLHVPIERVDRLVAVNLNSSAAMKALPYQCL